MESDNAGLAARLVAAENSAAASKMAVERLAEALRKEQARGDRMWDTQHAHEKSMCAPRPQKPQHSPHSSVMGHVVLWATCVLRAACVPHARPRSACVCLFRLCLRAPASLRCV